MAKVKATSTATTEAPKKAPVKKTAAKKVTAKKPAAKKPLPKPKAPTAKTDLAAENKLLKAQIKILETKLAKIKTIIG